MSYLSARLANIADSLEAEQRLALKSDIRELRTAAQLLGAQNLSDMAKLILTDKDALRTGMKQLTPKQLGVVLGLSLALLNDAGDTPLPELLRVLASQVDDLIETLEGA